MYLKTAGALTNSPTQKLRNQLGAAAGAVSSTYRLCQQSLSWMIVLSLSYNIFVVALKICQFLIRAIYNRQPGLHRQPSPNIYIFILE